MVISSEYSDSYENESEFGASPKKFYLSKSNEQGTHLHV